MIDNTKVRLGALTGLRFLAAMHVVVYHVGLSILSNGSEALYNVFNAGFISVGLFFVLSGFVLTYTYHNRPINLKTFYVSRFARIYPLYALALVMAIPFFFREVIKNNYSPVRVISSILAVPSLVQSWVPQTAISWNAPAWSLSAEAFFYLVFPFCLPYITRLKGQSIFYAAFSLIVIGLVAPTVYLLVNPDNLESLETSVHFQLHTVQTEGWLGVVIYNPLLHAPAFLFGMVTARLFILNQQSTRASLLRSLSTLLSFISITTLVLILCGSAHLPYPLLHNGLLLPLFGLLIYSLAWGKGPISWILSLPTLVLLGEISYGVYILQRPLSGYVKLAYKVTTDKLIEGHYPSVWLLLLYVMLLVAFSYFMYRMVEIPLRDRVKGLLLDFGVNVNKERPMPSPTEP